MTLNELKTIVDLLCLEGCGEIEATFDEHNCFYFETGKISLFIEKEDGIIFDYTKGAEGVKGVDGSLTDPDYRKEFCAFLKENFK